APSVAYATAAAAYATTAIASTKPPETASIPVAPARVRPAIAVQNAASAFGQDYVTVAANVSGRWAGEVNEGIVTFIAETIAGAPVRQVISAPVSEGRAQAELSLRGLPAGAYRIAANYDPLTTDSGYYASSAAATAATL